VRDKFVTQRHAIHETGATSVISAARDVLRVGRPAELSGMEEPQVPLI
jgi:hypothetical protein